MFTTRPYTSSIPNLQRIGNNNPMRFIKRNLEYEALINCGFCNQYTIYHEHECNDNLPWDPYDGYLFDAYDMD